MNQKGKDQGQICRTRGKSDQDNGALSLEDWGGKGSISGEIIDSAILTQRLLSGVWTLPTDLWKKATGNATDSAIIVVRLNLDSGAAKPVYRRQAVVKESTVFIAGHEARGTASPGSKDL